MIVGSAHDDAWLRQETRLQAFRRKKTRGEEDAWELYTFELHSVRCSAAVLSTLRDPSTEGSNTRSDYYCVQTVAIEFVFRSQTSLKIEPFCNNFLLSRRTRKSLRHMSTEFIDANFSTNKGKVSSLLPCIVRSFQSPQSCTHTPQKECHLQLSRVIRKCTECFYTTTPIIPILTIYIHIYIYWSPTYLN